VTSSPHTGYLIALQRYLQNSNIVEEGRFLSTCRFAVGKYAGKYAGKSLFERDRF